HLPAVFEADEGGPVGDVADERPRAVDRVDDPAVSGRRRRVAELLAEEPVAGEGGGQLLPKGPLRVAVGDGDRALVGLPLDGHVPVEVSQRELPGVTGGLDHDLVAGAPVCVHPVVVAKRCFAYAAAPVIPASSPSAAITHRTFSVARGRA